MLQGPQGGGKGVPESLDWFPEGETSCCDTLPSLGLGLSRGFLGGSSDDPQNHCPPVFPLGSLPLPSSLKRSQAWLSVCGQVQIFPVGVDLSSDWAYSSPALKLSSLPVPLLSKWCHHPYLTPHSSSSLSTQLSLPTAQEGSGLVSQQPPYGAPGLLTPFQSHP